MERIQPGVTLSESIITTGQQEIPSAVPVFIGYTTRNQQQAKAAVRIDNLVEYTQIFGDEHVMAFAVRHYFDNGGQQAFVLPLEGDMPSAKMTQTEAETLMVALRADAVREAIGGETQITLILAPDIARLNDSVIDDQPTLVKLWSEGWMTLLQLSQIRSNLFVLLDAPDEVKQAQQCLRTLSSGYRQWGAAYWPRLETTYRDKSGKQSIVLSPTAAIAAVIQRTDNEVGVWKAPANIALSQVIRPVKPYLQGAVLFNTNGTSLNVIRSFPGKGIRVWGCRTLENSDNTPWRYLQTRRLVSYVTVHLAQLARMYVFEPNNELTWMKCKGQSYNWLRQLWLQGGLYGSREDEAFTVQLGVNETMTEEDVRAGKMIMKVSLALLYPAEFIEISLVFDTQTGALLS
ncbi:phage tail sheath subtilisin-like domain-containing protein [Xenorhabdus bovienii]|uniref:Phage tail sheath subtilisin-like domain-containing protein n=2 Tax=Xenorhabdus bovienii TaxID=40576 RepID=A0AAJ1J581_XENBV|nr:phage tail sheath C-terminal domain-containing protein [Xenorhabdus bovienii]MDE1477390.1 phage tail sheath subtilisin-like domain-containing protein [Xenorhabdus bovienii]MDE1485573.1 phage tail sheath subtilisin-like domain-containing protein [Xenorhabdus bovienii]MDE1489545.1 phage tail sheath subtilisin-like domain-containing protein [Xenorhabdus bovienii]MDE9476145.1 phage tail sheath subtilisin-like domain-containing protein [Xenorhabdus bovienii]MDE9509057.1 phage tail sheath subtili